MTADFINGLFEFAGGMLAFNHCRVAYKDKQVAGVSIFSILAWVLWGFWNLYYYPSLEQWWSFYGGLFVVTANVLWVYLLLLYRSSVK